MPQLKKPRRSKEEFYEQPENYYNIQNKRSAKIIMGDMNAQIGKEPIYRKTVGTESKNEVINGGIIMEFSEEKNMKVMSTHFKSYRR